MRVDQSTLNQVNKRNVINIIRENGPINRTEIAHLAGLSLPTIMRLAEKLIDKKIIVEIGKAESTGGKPPMLLEFARNSYCMVGVDIGTTNIKTIIMNMAAEIMASVVTPTIITDPPESIIKRIISSISDVISKSNISCEQILGIGLGMPGLLDAARGIVLFSPDFKWENIDLVAPIKEHFGMPVHMANVTRAMAMGEKLFGSAGNTSNFMCINLGYGIGSAVVINNEIYSGGSDTSGEFGHMTLEKNGPQCSCGNFGCLEALASANAMSKKAFYLIERGEKSQMTTMVDSPENINAKVIFDAARNGDSLAREIVRDATEYIGIAIANVVNFIDPELIILEGGVALSGDILLNNIKRVVERRQMKYAGRKLKIITSELRENAAAIGAASFLLHELINNGGDISKLAM